MHYLKNYWRVVFQMLIDKKKGIQPVIHKVFLFIILFIMKSNKVLTSFWVGDLGIKSHLNKLFFTTVGTKVFAAEAAMARQGL